MKTKKQWFLKINPYYLCYLIALLCVALLSIIAIIGTAPTSLLPAIASGQSINADGHSGTVLPSKESNPNNAQKLYEAGKQKYSTENWLEALTYFKQTIEVNPHNADAWFYTGYCYSRLDRHAEAVEAYQQAIQINPDDAVAYNNLGASYIQLRRYVEAVDICRQAIKIKPDFAEALHTLSVAKEAIRINSDLAKVTQNNLTNVNEMPIKQEQSRLLKEQDDRTNDLQQWLQKERQNIEDWYGNARRRIPEQRQNIENWYRNNLGSLQQWRNAAIGRLNADDRGATARFVQNQKNTISYADVESVTNGYISPYGYVSATTSSFGVRSTSVRGDPASQFSSETAYIANSKITVENNYQEELRKLQNQKSRYLNSISENSLQCEKTRALQEAERYVENVSKVAASKKRDITTTTEDRLAGGPGVIIDAIGKTGKKCDCVIGGSIYHQGDFVNGFKIQKISAREVIFEKGGKPFVKGL